MGNCFVNPAALLAVAAMLADMASNAEFDCKPTRKPKPCGCNRVTQPRDEFGRFARAVERPVHPTTAPRWGVCECEPREDENKVFGINVGRIDEPTPDMFCTRARFLDARRKWDNLVDAVEAVDWPNKSNTAPLHKVNCIRRRIEDGPVMGVNLCGETRWF